MSLVPAVVQISQFCRGISAGNQFENDSQDLYFSVAIIFGQRIVSRAELSPEGSLSLSLVPFSLGRIVLNFTVADSGGREFGAENTWSHTAQVFVTSNSAVNQPPFASLFFNSKPLRDPNNDVLAFVNVTACAGPGDESEYQSAAVNFLVCANGTLLDDMCNASFVIVRSTLLGSARDFASGLLCPLWSMEYLVPRNFHGSSVVAANVTDEFGLMFLLRIPVVVEYVNYPPEFDLKPSDIEIVQPEGPVSVMLYFSNVSAGRAEVGQSVFFNIAAENPSDFSQQPTLSNLTNIDSDTVSALASFSVALKSIGKNVSLLLFATDNGGTLHGGRNISLHKKVNLILLATNKHPRFSLARRSIVVSESTFQTIQIFKNFAFDITAGQPAEHLQMLRFHCDTFNSFLFEIQPSISFDGTLTFKVASNTFGDSNVTVHLFEIGSTALRFTSSFMIYVDRLYDNPAILSLSSAQLHVQEGSVNEFDRFVQFTAEPDLPSSVNLKFNASVILNKSAPFFLMNSDDPLINVSVTIEGKLLISCALRSWGHVLVGISLMQTVVNNEVSSFVSISGVKVFSVFVSPMNDPPSFSFRSDVIVISQERTTFTSSNFIQDINVGPSDEKELISQIYCISPHRAIKHVVVISECLNKSFCPFASLSFELVPYSQGLANVTCCVHETQSETCLSALSCTSLTCKHFSVLIPVVMELVSKGDIILYQNDYLVDGLAVTFPSHIRVISPHVASQINVSVMQSNSCSRLFLTVPSAAISNVSFVDISFFPSQFFGECLVTVTVALVHDSGTDFSSVTLMIRLLRTNQKPLFSITSPIVSVLESTGNYSIRDFASNISAGFEDSDQAIHFDVQEVPTTTNRFSSSQVFMSTPFIDPMGRLVFNLFPFVFGNFVFVVRLFDIPVASHLMSRNSSDVFIYINILPVNDPPVFTLKNRVITLVSSSQPMLESMSIFQYVSAGPNEDDQTLSCSIQSASSSFRNEMFVVPPTIVAKELSMIFQVAPRASGVVNYTVICLDDGNYSYGLNRSLPAVFVIEILRPNSPPFFHLSQSTFAINSSLISSVFSIQPFSLYSPSMEYAKNSISRFSIQLLPGNTSLSTVITQQSHVFDSLSLLLPLSVRRRIVDYIISAPKRDVGDPRYMFVSEKASLSVSKMDSSVVSSWKISEKDSSATRVSQIEDGMVHFSHVVQSYILSRRFASCAISSAVDSGRIFIFVSAGCNLANSFNHSVVPARVFATTVVDFTFNMQYVYQKRVSARNGGLNGTIVGIENGIRYYGAVGAMLCSPVSGVLRVDDSVVAIRSLMTQFSVSVWFALGSFSSENPLLSSSKLSDDNMDRGWKLVITRQRQLKFSVSIMDGSVGRFFSALSAPNLVVPQKWTHVLASFNDKSIDLYVNGALVANYVIPETIAFRSVVYSQVTVASDKDSDMSVFVGAAYEGSVLSSFHGVIASCVIYAGAAAESDAVRLFNSGSFMTNRFIDVSGLMFDGNSSSISTEHILTFTNVLNVEHALNRPLIDTPISFEISCATDLISGACSLSVGGLFVSCPLIPTTAIFSSSCVNAPFYLLLNENLVLASSFISSVTIRSSSFMLMSHGSPSNFQLSQDFPEASSSTGSASASFRGKQYLFFLVANVGTIAPISPAYVLQGESYQRKPSLDVRVFAASAIAALTHDYSRTNQNQVLVPCMYVAYASLLDTSFVYKYSGSESNVSLVQVFAVPFIGGATSVSITKAGTKYGSDVVLVSFCGISGCQIFMLISSSIPSVKSMFKFDAKAVWLFSTSESSQISILVSFNTNTSSFFWDSSVFDASHDTVTGFLMSPYYVSNFSAISASFALVGSQDILFLGLPNIQALFKYDPFMKMWIPIMSFSSPSPISTSVVIKDPRSSGAIYVSAFALANTDVQVWAANISISQGGDFVTHLQSCDSTQSLYILRSLDAGMVDVTSAMSWFNISSGYPLLLAELGQDDSMKMLGAYRFAIDCETGYIGIAHSGGISLVASNLTSRSLQRLSLMSPSSSIFGADLLSVSAMAFASFPGRFPVLVVSSRDRGCVDTFTLSKTNDVVFAVDGSSFRDGQKHLNWLTRSSTNSVPAPSNRSLPFWNKAFKSFYSFVSSGKSYIILLGKCNDPASSTQAVVMEDVGGQWIFRQELPGTLGACVASTCEQTRESLFLFIGINAFGGSSQKSIIFKLSVVDGFYSSVFFQNVDTMAVVDVASYLESGKCSYILVQKTDGLLPSGSLPPMLLHFDSGLGIFRGKSAVNTTAYSVVASHVWKASRIFVLTRRKCFLFGTGICSQSLSISSKQGDESFQELAALPCSEASSMSSLVVGDSMIIAMTSIESESSVFRFNFQSNVLVKTDIFPSSFNCLVYRLGQSIQLAFLNYDGLGFRSIVEGKVKQFSVIPSDYMYDGLSDELKSKFVFQTEKWNISPDSSWKLNLQHTNLGDVLLVLDTADGALDAVIAAPSVISLRGPASISAVPFSNFKSAALDVNLAVFSVSPYKVSSFQLSLDGSLQFEFSVDLFGSSDLLNAQLAVNRSGALVDVLLYNKGGSNFEEDQSITWSASVISGNEYIDNVILEESDDENGPARLEFRSQPRAFGTSVIQLSIFDKHFLRNNDSYVDISSDSKFEKNITLHFDMAPPVNVLLPEVVLAVNSSRKVRVDKVLSFDSSLPNRNLIYRVTVTQVTNPTMFSSAPVLDMHGSLFLGTTFVDSSSVITVLVRWLDLSMGSLTTSLNIRVRFVTVNRPPIPVIIRNITMNNQLDRYSPSMSTFVDVVSFVMSFDGKDANQTLNPLNPFQYRYATIDGIAYPDNSVFHVSPHLHLNGTLQFALIPSVFGVITMYFTAQDTGGTNMGGVDTSALFPIHLHHLPAVDPPLLFLPSFAVQIDGSPSCNSEISCLELNQPIRPPMYGLRIIQDSGVSAIQCLVRPGYSRVFASISQATVQAVSSSISNVSISLNGLLTLQPAVGFFGRTFLDIFLADSHGSSSFFSVPVDVINSNEPPSISVIPDVELVLHSFGPPLPAANISDDMWLRYTLLPGSGIVGSWYPSSASFGTSHQNVMLEGTGCFEIWTNGSVYMEQGNLLPNGHISEICPSCGNNLDNIGSCNAAGSLTCSESGTSSYRCVLQRLSSSLGLSVIGTWSGYCEQLSGMLDGKLQCAVGPCRQEYTVIYNGSHVRRILGPRSSNSTCFDSRPVYNVPGFVVSASVGSNPLESSTQSIVSVIINRDSLSSISTVSKPIYNIHTGILTFQTLPGAVGVLKLRVVAFDSSDYCCSNNFSSEVVAHISIQAPPRIVSISPDIISPSGGNVLSIIGQYFASSLSHSVSVFIGSSECIDAVILSDVVITCTAPPGFGMESVSVYIAGATVRSAIFPKSLTYASFIFGGSLEESRDGLGFWGLAPASSIELSQGDALSFSSTVSNVTVGLQSRQLLQTEAVGSVSFDPRVTSSAFEIAASDRFEGRANVTATISFVPSIALSTGGSITVQFPANFFDVAVTPYAISPGSSSVPSLSAAPFFASNATLILTTSSSFGGSSSGRVAAGTMFTITLTGLTMGRSRSGAAALEGVFFATSVDTSWSNPVACGPILYSLRESRIVIHPAYTLAKSNLTISFIPTNVIDFRSVTVTLTGFTSSLNPLSVTDMLGFSEGASATSTLNGGVLTTAFYSATISSDAPVSFRIVGVINSAKSQPPLRSIHSATTNSLGSVLDSTTETVITALQSSLKDVSVNFSSSVAGTQTSIFVTFASYSIISLVGGSISVVLTGFTSPSPAFARALFGFSDVPSATVSLSSGVLVVQFSSGSLRAGQSASFIVDNIENPRTPQPASNTIVATLVGFTASGSSATENTEEGRLTSIMPSLSDVDVRLNSSIAGAFVTATISFTPTSTQNIASFLVTLSGFSAASGHNLTVSFIPVDGLGIKVGEGFVGFNRSTAIPDASATILDGLLTVVFLSGSVLAKSRVIFTVASLVSPHVPQPALNSLRASTFSLLMELLDATDSGKLSALFGPLPYLASLEPIDASFLFSLDGNWSGTCSAFAGLSAKRPDLGTVCSPVPLSAAYSVLYSAATQTYSTMMKQGLSWFASYPNIDNSLNSYSSERFDSFVQIASARDGSLKGVASGNTGSLNSSTCASVAFTGANSLVEWGWATLGGRVPQFQKCGPSLPIPRSACSSSTGMYSYVCTLSRTPDSLIVPSPALEASGNSKNFRDIPETRVTQSPTVLHVKENVEGSLTAAALTSAWGGASRGVYIGGNFKRAGNSSFTHHIAQWYGGKFLPLAYGLDGPVNALAIDKQFLYMGGSFSRAFQSSTSIVRSGPILKWHTSRRVFMALFTCDQSSAPNSPPPISNGIVSSIALHDGGVAFAGRFASVCTQLAGNVAFVSYSGDVALFQGGVSGGHVASLGSLGTDLYVGGHFTMAGSLPARGIARWDGNSWNALGGGVIRGSVQAIAIMGSTVFIAGNFDSVDGGRLAAPGVAAWIDHRWRVVGGGIFGSVHSLAVVAPCVIAGGSFRFVANSSTFGLARICGTEELWEAISLNPGSSSEKIAFLSDSV
jgi:hypothetical protein